MHSSRVLRVFLPFAVVLVVVAIGVSVLTARPDISDAKDRVDQTWTPLEQQLNERYGQLRDLASKVGNSGALGELASNASDAVDDWTRARGVSARVRAANRVEALGRRLVVAALASARVQRDKNLTGLVAAYAATTAPDARSFNGAVAKYERERRGPVRGVVARFMGDGRIPAYVAITS